MIATIHVPTVNTDDCDFETDIKLTREQYGELVYRRYEKNYRPIDNMMTQHYKNNSGMMYENYRQSNKEIDYEDKEVETNILDSSQNEITKDFFYDHAYKMDMFVIYLNFNCETITQYAETEIKFWMDESKRILDDNELPDTLKIEILPKRIVKIILDKRVFKMINCKIVDIRGDEKNPYYFAIIAEKLIR